MWRIDRTADWPYYWICCCLNKPDTWEDDLTESTLESERCRDSVTDVMIMMFMLESFCLSWIIIPGVTPGETVTRWGWDPVWSDVKLSFVVRLPTTGITMYHSPHLHSHPMRAQPSSHTWGQYLAGDDYNLFLSTASASILCTNHWMPIISA